MNRSPHAPEKSLSRHVYGVLLDGLLANELVPGELLNRRDVARDLGVSVAPVLEAMLQLEMEGFLESIPRKGTRVRPIRREDVIGQLVVREALECGAGRLYCGDLVVAHYEELLQLANRVDGFQDESPGRWETEIAFHQRLVRLTEIGPLIREFERNFRLNVFYRINHVLGAPTGHVVNRHTELLEELTSGDPEKAERAIRRHVRSGKGHLFDG